MTPRKDGGHHVLCLSIGGAGRSGKWFDSTKCRAMQRGSTPPQAENVMVPHDWIWLASTQP
jgi:hypothetical protein